MPIDWSLTWLVFVMGSTLVMLISLLVGGRQGRLVMRLRVLARSGEPAGRAEPVAGLARSALPKMGAVLLPKSAAEQTKLQARLVHAGFYGRQAVALFLGVKMLLILAPPLVGLALGLAGIVNTQRAFLIGALAGTVGVIGPSFWLDKRKAERQTSFRRALPDALDVLVICLEGGTSFPAAIRKVAAELRTAHPLLATELNIVQREMQLGRSAGDALRQFAHRSDLEEIRSMASVILQSERFGAGLVRSLRVHAESFRGRRVQRAEEMAQKAVVKLLFPTVLFIMPALFIVILGPLVWEALTIWRGMSHRG